MEEKIANLSFAFNDVHNKIHRSEFISRRYNAPSTVMILYISDLNEPCPQFPLDWCLLFPLVDRSDLKSIKLMIESLALKLNIHLNEEFPIRITSVSIQLFEWCNYKKH